MTEVLFYHLQGRSLEQALPVLLEKCLERGWRSVVQLGSVERRDALDNHLWTYREESFLPHGSEAEGQAERQPVWLTLGDDNPNDASVRFVADGAGLPDVASYDRVVLIFDGNDPEAVDRARAEWKVLKETDHEITYWQQTPAGGWEKRA